MSNNVIGFAEARAGAYARELKWLESGLANNLRKIGTWPAIWFDNDNDRAFAIDQAMKIANKLYLERCIVAASKYDADADYFEAALQNYPGDSEEMWAGVSRLIMGDDE